MVQPIPKKTVLANPEIIQDPIEYSLILDMNSIMKTCMVDDKVNTKGERYGMVFQVLLQIKNLLNKVDFSNVYAMYDGNSSGILRFKYLAEYKANRSKNYDLSEVKSDYYKEMDKFVKRVLDKRNKEKDPKKVTEDESLFIQKDILVQALDELCIRQLEYENCEGDDLIAYYIKQKRPNNRVYIVSNDNDLTQLISNEKYVAQYMIRLKNFVTEKNFNQYFDYNISNVVLTKILLGDQSDCISGVKGLGTKTLFDMMPEIKERKVELWEVIKRAKELNEQRVKDKKKPLAVYDNIINGVTNGLQKDLYEINNKIINLSEPLLTQEAIDGINDMMYAPMDVTDRSLANLYKLVLKYGIDELVDSNRFANFFSSFNGLREKETKYYNKWLSENN